MISTIVTATVPAVQCPFCQRADIPAVPGKATCQECGTLYEIDDRGECIFVDLENPRIPINGIYCRACGLVQGMRMKNCHFCATLVNSQWHEQ